MSAEPIIKQWTLAKQAALNTYAFCTEAISGATFYRLATANVLLDMLNNPNPATMGTDLFRIDLYKDYMPTGRSFFSEAMNPTSAGRMAVGPIRLKAGNLNFYAAMTAGTLAAYTFIIKLACA